MLVLAGTIMLSLGAVTTNDVGRRVLVSTASTVTLTAKVNTIDDVTEGLGTIYGKLTGVTIAATGSDTSFKVYVKESNGYALFSKTDCNATSCLLRYALSASDTGSTEFVGVPVAGAVSVQVADANDANMVSLTVTVYYDQDGTI